MPSDKPVTVTIFDVLEDEIPVFDTAVKLVMAPPPTLVGAVIVIIAEPAAPVTVVIVGALGAYNPL